MKTLALLFGALLLATSAAAVNPMAEADAQSKQIGKFKKSTPAPSSSAGAADLSSLLRGLNDGPKVVPDPSPDESSTASDVKVKAILAAVDYIAGDGLSKAKAGFAGVMERPGSAGGTEGPSDQDFLGAAQMIRRLILAPPDAKPRIAVGKTTTRAGGGSAGWGLESYETPANGQPLFPGGSVDFADPPREMIGQSGPDDRNYQRLKMIDGWANGVLHEAIHIYYDVFWFNRFRGKSGVAEPPYCFGQTLFAMGTKPNLVCANQGCPPTYKTVAMPKKGSPAEMESKPCYRPCGDAEFHTCYSWDAKGPDASGPTEYLARTLSLDMTEASGGQALKRIIDASR